MRPFLEAIRDEIVVVDGAMGSFLMEQGLPPGAPPEEWNLSRPEKIENIHRLYLKAGARVITANSFNATRRRLSEWKLDPRDVNRKAVEIALKASEGKAWVFGSVGPLGTFISPLGELSFDEAREIYREQILALVEAGAHGLIVETISDIKEMKAILVAAREVFDGPLIAQMVFGTDERTITGTPPESVCVTVSALRVNALGANCGLGPDEMLGVIRKFAGLTSLPLVAQPNAGLPELRDGRSHYPATPEDMAACSQKLVSAGVTVVGSCCGSTPDHTRAISQAVSRMKPAKRAVEGTAKGKVNLASRTNWVTAGFPQPFLMVGERINPSGKPGLSAELRRGVTKLLREEAVRQVEMGARCLDLNVSVAGTDEASLMSTAAQSVEKVADVPIFVDGLDAGAIEAALKRLPGRCVINSVPARQERMDILLPLAARYGCAIVALAVGEKGVADSSASKIEALENILGQAQKYGLGETDIFFDPAILTLSSGVHHVRQTLDALRIIRDRGWVSILGVSNVSYGMPQRELLNATLLSMAMSQGLDAAFLNPSDEKLKEIILASSALVRDEVLGKKSLAFFSPGRPEARHAEAVKATGAGEPSGRKVTAAEALEQSLAQGEKDEAIQAAELLLGEGKSVSQVIESFLVPAMRKIGERFEKGELFLPHVVMAAEAAQGIFRILSERSKGEVNLRGKIVIGTVEGDVHDIGKNLVAMMLRTHGYEVIDLGKGVPCEDLVSTAEESGADIVAMSALLTTTMPRMGEVAELLRRRGVLAKVLVGGAPVNETFASKIGAAYAPNAVEAVRRADDLIK